MDRIAKKSGTAAVILAVCGILAGEAWAAEMAAPDTTKPTPATIAWGEAVSEVQAGLVPLGGMKEAWGNRSLYYVSPSNPFECPNCAGKPRKHSMPAETAAEERRCAVCATPKPWGAAFVAGEPMRLEVHLKNAGKEACSLYDARYGEHWRFTFTAVGGGIVWEAQLNMPKARRTGESFQQSMIPLAAGQQNAVVFDLGDDDISFADSERRAPSVKRLPPGKYTVTATYAHPMHAQRTICPYWHGTVTTAPVEIEVKADDATARFLDAAKYAGFAAVAEVKALPQAEQAGDTAKLSQLGIEWKELLYAPDAVRNAMTGVKALALPYLKPGVADTRATAELKIGDRILVVVDERTVSFRVRSANGRALVPVWLEGAQWLPWTQSRQDALQAALAPGWQSGCCPWCQPQRGNWERMSEKEAMQAEHEAADKGEAVPKTQNVCQACNKPTALPAKAKFCPTCAAQRGECWACERTIGPATRDVTFRLWAFDPTVPQDKPQSNVCRIQAGTDSLRLRLWVEVQNEKGETPEFQTPGGGAGFDGCKTLFYLVEGPGLSAPTTAFNIVLEPRGRMMIPVALQKGSATGQVLLFPGKLFTTPGTYTMRAVAGRLVSSPVTIIVEPETEAQRQARQEAEAKTQVDRKQEQQERELRQRQERELKQRAMEQGSD
jgi:hypothetical protein